jgi:hypothetical protein
MLSACKTTPLKPSSTDDILSRSLPQRSLSPLTHITTPEFEAIRCRSTLALNPLSSPLQNIKETYRPQLSSLLPHGPRNSTPLHLALRIHNHPRVVLEVQVHAVRAPPRLALAHDNRGHDLFAELGLALLDGRHDHVAYAGGGEAVQAGAEALHGDDVEVPGAGVVAAVHYGAAVKTSGWCEGGERGETERERGETYTGRPRVILSLLPEAPPRLLNH